tara:strand:- start:2743 stop:3210 length:468 start_codon:yes stop_codon:yes gene_type:complete
MKRWHTGSGYEISMKDIEEELSTHISGNGDIFLGCDSFLKGGKCIFASVICLHGADNQSGGRYFWVRENYDAEKYLNLQYRIFSEVSKSVSLAMRLSERFPKANIELHIDISSKETAKTHKFVDALTGFAKSAGFNCQIKPYAWAAAAIADKHSK